MNKVFLHEQDIYPLTPEGLAMAARELNEDVRITTSDYPERITGNHCNCLGNGEFVLQPAEKGQKRYMRCRICSGYSHL